MFLITNLQRTSMVYWWQWWVQDFLFWMPVLSVRRVMNFTVVYTSSTAAAFRGTASNPSCKTKYSLGGNCSFWTAAHHNELKQNSNRGLHGAHEANYHCLLGDMCRIWSWHYGKVFLFTPNCIADRSATGARLQRSGLSLMLRETRATPTFQSCRKPSLMLS